ncbi:MAG: hypothetical protein CML39_01425 [Rhodobacteraceae bacterium]|nr:MAG: hypothetical protein CML39_01425 [Paracoccaceae bacterium]
MSDFKINANKIFVYLLIISAQKLGKKNFLSYFSRASIFLIPSLLFLSIYGAQYRQDKRF